MNERFELHPDEQDLYELISAYLDDELDDTTTEFVSRQLETNDDYQRVFEELQYTVQELRTLPGEATPEVEIWPQIEERLAGAGARSKGARGRWTPSSIYKGIAAGLGVLLIRTYREASYDRSPLYRYVVVWKIGMATAPPILGSGSPAWTAVVSRVRCRFDMRSLREIAPGRRGGS